MKDIKQDIKDIISKKGWKIPFLAQKMGFSKQNVYNVLNGDQEITLPFLEAVTRALEVEMMVWFDQNPDHNDNCDKQEVSRLKDELDRVKQMVDEWKDLYEQCKEMNKIYQNQLK